MKQKTIKSKNGIVHYWIGGSQRKNSTCIVFNHGMTADHSMFDQQIDYFIEEYRVITWDIPLHGESRPYKNFTYSNVVKELNEILKKEDIEKVILVGQSMGGYICQEFARYYPEKIEAFIAVGTNPFGHYYYSDWEMSLLTNMARMSSWIPYNALIESIVGRSTMTKCAYENLYNSITELSKDEIIYIMDIVYDEFSKRKESVSLSFPVLLIVGENDSVGQIKKYNYMWSYNTGYPLIEIKNAAHNANVDNSEEFNRILEEFLSKL